MYKRWLGAALFVVFFLFPAWLNPLRRALTGLSSLVSFPIAGILMLYLIFHFRFRQVGSALLALILLWLPLYHPFAPQSARAEASRCQLLALIEQLADEAAQWENAPLIEVQELCAACAQISGNCIKISRFPEWMKFTRTAGIFIPLTGEAIINPLEPLFSLPFTAMHEIAHQRGIMDEGDANAWAFQACMRSGNASFRYSACVYVLKYALIRLWQITPSDAFTVDTLFSARVWQDLAALGAFNKASLVTRAFPPFAGDYSSVVDTLLMEDFSGSKSSVAVLSPTMSQGVSMPSKGASGVPSSVMNNAATRFS